MVLASLVNLDHPLVESLVVPLLLSLAGVGLCRVARCERCAGVAVGLAFVIAAGLIVGGWARQPQTALQKLPWAVCGYLSLAMLVRVAPARWLSGYAVLVAFVALMLGWLGWGRIGQGDWALIGVLAVLGVVALIAEWGLRRATPAPATEAAAPLVAALGLAAVAFEAGSLVLMQLSLALAVALGGFALWNWPSPRLGSNSFTGSTGVALLALIAALLVLLTPVRGWALVPLAGVFALPGVVGKVVTSRMKHGAAVEPVAVVALGLLLCAVAVWLAQSGAAPPDDDYYH